MSEVAQAATEQVQGTPEAELSTAEPQATEEIELNEDEEVKAPSEEPKKRSGFARRAEKFQREKDELAAERDYWRQLALESNKTGNQPETKTEPRLEDFESMADYLAARDGWLEERVVTKVLGTVKNANKNDRALSAHEARVQAVKKELTDWDDVFEEAGDMQVPPDTAQFVLESEVGPKIAYHLAKNPSEMDRLLALSPTRRLAELGKLEDRLATKAPAPAKKTSAAPPKLVETKGGTDVLPPGRPTSFTEWKANRDRQAKR